MAFKQVLDKLEVIKFGPCAYETVLFTTNFSFQCI